MADITNVPAWSGFLHVAIVLDVWNRRVVGWAMRKHLRTELEFRSAARVVGERSDSARRLALQAGERSRKTVAPSWEGHGRQEGLLESRLAKP